MRGIIDRIEENIAVCEMDGRDMKNIPLSSFPEIPKEGDVFEYEGDTITLLPDETAKRKETVQSLFDRLKKKA